MSVEKLYSYILFTPLDDPDPWSDFILGIHSTSHPQGQHSGTTGYLIKVIVLCIHGTSSKVQSMILQWIWHQRWPSFWGSHAFQENGKHAIVNNCKVHEKGGNDCPEWFCNLMFLKRKCQWCNFIKDWLTFCPIVFLERQTYLSWCCWSSWLLRILQMTSSEF